ncbi:MAG: hypothetical protein P4M05_19605 [Bradyrhizobium sp.]|nr:hypothetical protein [Bradyrhizobium sp.]
MTDWWANDPVAKPAGARASGGSWWQNDPVVSRNAGPLTRTADEGFASGAAKGLATGAIKGVGNAVGFAGDIGNFSDYLLARGESAITGKKTDDILNEIRDSRKGDKNDSWLHRLVKAIDPRNVLPSGQDVSGPILARTGEYVPETSAGRIGEAGAEALFSGVGPGMGRAIGPAREIVGGLGRMALGNAVAGAGSQAASEAGADPLLATAAGIGAAGIAGAGSNALRRVAAPAAYGIPGIENAPKIGSLASQAIERQATQRLLDRSSNPNELRAWAGTNAGDETVPGSPRSTAAAVGNDRGLFQAEKDARNANNIPFNALDARQNEAQTTALRGVQPEGDVFLPGQMLRQRIDAIDAAAQDVEDRLNAAHQHAVTVREQATQDFLRRQQNRSEAAGAGLARQAADAQSGAEARARGAAGGLGEGTNADELGSRLRTAIEDVRGATKKAHNALYDAVDPEGTLSLVATPIRERARQIGDQLKEDGAEFDPAEAPLFRRAIVLKDVTPYRKLQTLDRDISAAMSKERRAGGETPAWARLVRLKGAVKDAMVQAVDNQARHEAQQVAQGLMEPEDTIGFRLAEDAKAYTAERAGRSSISARASGNGAASSPGISGSSTGKIQSRGGFADASRDQSIQGLGLEPNFDDAARRRLGAANTAYANYAQTYKNPTVGPGLRTTGYSGQYQVPDAAFIKRAVVPGERGYEAAAAHLRAAGNSPEAVSAMQSAALDPLRKTTLPTGTIHPQALIRWKERYGPALRALDEVSPGFSRQFDDAAQATQALFDMSAQQKQAIADFEKNAAAQALSLKRERYSDDAALNAQSKASASDQISRARDIAREARNTPAGQFAAQGGDRISPVEVENAVGNVLKTGTSGVTRMRSLVQSVSENPAALAGLRRAGVDYLLRTYSSADGTLSGARLAKFVRDNNDVLRELYPAEQVSTINAIARDLEANSRWRTETAIKAGSDTAKNLKPMLEKALEEGKRHVSIMSAAVAGFLAGGPKGALTGGMLYLINSLRSAGIRKVDDLYREALLDPKVARALIQKMPAGVDVSKLRNLSALLQRAAIVAPLQMQKQQ